ncbi:NUDIX domain protein [Clostridium puniceum]|uniref:NUDIX domain protein n=1 Tax=Clostridium puniceum TaxID=29367 RepID=A0A1S8T9S5_9CLOT|nr:NUDIX hydrolase [Clostridium puniceum]OOM74351.1 NUDIX domain protein [Clostridium puniceum]
MYWVDSIKNYIPCNNQEKNDKKIILNSIDTFNDILTRHNEVIHITSSAFIVNKNRNKTLMIHHNIYNSWCWTGGHADGEIDLLLVALNEAKEETGVKNIFPINDNIYSLDIFPVLGRVKNGHYISSHLHISVAYLMEADDNETLIVKADENSGVKWIPIDEIDVYSNEEHMKKVYGKILDKLK